jgi:hypothetical protein
MRRIALPALTALLLIAPAAHAADITVPAARDTEPVILTGKDLAEWAVPANQTVKLPLMDMPECGSALTGDGCHNNYSEPEVDTGDAAGAGTPTDRIVAFRWTGGFTGRWQEVPIQVDEQFTRYLDNSASGFAPYSGQDQHTTYAFDREGFRWRAEDPSNPCLAKPDSPVATDPVPGLDTNDEVVFMASDGGPAAPGGGARPPGVKDLKVVVLGDPSSIAGGGNRNPKYLYIGRTDGTRKPAFDGSNGYVEYQRDANADFYEFSQSSYSDYGNAPTGMTCDADGNPTGRIGRRRPRDYATITTDRYRFRYDGRWLMTKVEISPDGGRTYGPDLVDRWKARAFAQDPGSRTPCCGFEEEDTNWGGSSTLLGEKVGPVRAIRETWGADSGTNVIRRETFYRREMRQKTYLRVHVIPPLDGIYAQWDFNAGRVTKYYNSRKPDGVDVDGVNDEVMGNFDDPCQPKYDTSSTSDFDQTYRSLARMFQLCSGQLPREPEDLNYHLSMDFPDLTHSEAGATLGWSQVSGQHGTIVDRYDAQLTSQSPGGAVQGAFAVPYYRDDSCFDDGTGSDPGPKVRLRSGDEPSTSQTTGGPRKCWAPSDGLPDGTDRYYQGSIATHGLHILLVADSDNARLTVPTTEIVGEQRMVMLPGFRDGTAGEQYGRAMEKPLVPVVAPAP